MAECGTHLTMRRPSLPAVILKVDTFDDPRLFGGPQDGDLYVLCFVHILSKEHGIGVWTWLPGA
jgi:hypothetical protein